MSPEQLYGKDLDGRSDLWALGAILYEAATTEKLFRGHEAPEIMIEIISEPGMERYGEVRSRLDRVDEPLRGLIARLVARRLSDRFPDAAAAAEAFELEREVGARRELAAVADELKPRWVTALTEEIPEGDVPKITDFSEVITQSADDVVTRPDGGKLAEPPPAPFGGGTRLLRARWFVWVPLVLLVLGVGIARYLWPHGDPDSTTGEEDPLDAATAARLAQEASELETDEGAARAFRLFLHACALGDLQSCLIAGDAQFEGIGTVVDHGGAVTSYRQSCEAGYAAGCNRLALRYLYGEGVEKDPGQAVELFRSACDGGLMLACGNLGHRFLNGEGVPKDSKAAAESYRVGCDGGYAPACTSLGHRYRRGDGVAADLSTARDLYRLACDGGDEKGCDWFKRVKGAR